MMRMGGDGGIEEWWANIPYVTRGLLGWTCIISLGVRFGLARWVFWSWQRVSAGEVWRFFTNIGWAGPFGFGWLMHVYMFSQFAALAEGDEDWGELGDASRNALAARVGRTGGEGVRVATLRQAPDAHNASYIVDRVLSTAHFLWVILWVILLAPLVTMAVIPGGASACGDALLMFLLAFWSRRSPEAPINVYFWTVRAQMLPFLLAGFHFLLGGIPWLDLYGMAAAHLYHAARYTLPPMGWHGYAPRPPQWFVTATWWVLNKLVWKRQSLRQPIRTPLKPTAAPSAHNYEPIPNTELQQRGGEPTPAERAAQAALRRMQQERAVNQGDEG